MPCTGNAFKETGTTLKPIAVLTAILVVTLCLVARFMTGGWLIFPGMLVYPVIGITHIWCHAKTIPRFGRIERARMKLMAVSHMCLVIAFLLQWDVGDGPSWLTVTALLGKGPGWPNSDAPSWWPGSGDRPLLGVTINLLLYVPAVVSWVLLVQRRQRRLTQPTK